ncbi:hypothetical protein [Methanothermobacter sp. K4]|uniref:hypothetical protein n=1 Tax=Methanothermobacter sp. K4 TaxID=2913262 RepID=UPI001EDBBF30|nr:hypothetical protein [Methanothermobacter sp. K4]MCG2829258.1 hypothetical protein [Methanothermobacter sp. K4]
MITHLKDHLLDLKTEQKDIYEIFNRIYDFGCDEGHLKVSESLKERFGIKFIESAENQRIISIYNRWTGEGSLFNSMRLKKPAMDTESARRVLDELIEDKKRCDFCRPELYTPEDDFGRVVGRHSITASNIAKYDAWSGLLIFRKHDPLDFTLEEFSDYLITASKWFKMAEKSSGLHFPFMVWNCLPRAGASQIHGHMQLLLGRRPYARIAFLDDVSRRYRKRYGSSYHDDVFSVHHALGLGVESGGAFIYASITPLKEKEIIMTFKTDAFRNSDLQNYLFKILRCLIDECGVYSFNLSMHPFNAEMEIPGIIRIVDRGNIASASSDMGGMELFGSSVIGSDPYIIFDRLKGALDA